MIIFRIVLMTFITFIMTYMTFFACRTISIFYKKKLPKLAKFCIWAAFLILGVLFYYRSCIIMIFALCVLTMFSLLMQFICFIIKKISKNYKDGKIYWIYRLGIIPILCTIIYFGYGYYNMNNIVEKNYNVNTYKLNANESIKIGYIADVHMGTTINKEKLKKIADSLSKADIDVLLMGGDIYDENTTKQEMIDATAIIGNVKTRDGIYYVFGNHDKNKYTSNPNYVPQDIRMEMKKNKITVMEDTFKYFDRYVIIGRQDLSEGENRFNSSEKINSNNNTVTSSNPRQSMENIIKNVDKSKLVIVLDHQPKELNENTKLGVDIQIDGHTHGGQLWPIGLINEIFGIDDLNYGQKTIDNFTAIVTSGVSGWGLPIRTQAHSEYLIVTVKGK